MCVPSVPKPREYQQSETPVYREGMFAPRTTGRRGTIRSGTNGQPQTLLGSSSQSGSMGSQPVAPKRTLLGG